MNAGIRGTMFVKSDRINTRVDDIAKVVINQMTEKEKNEISKEDFIDFVKTIHVIVDTELNEKGVERQWKRQ